MAMTSYLDITILPNHEISRYFLWEKLYAQLHLALVAHKNSSGKFSIAVAFPQYNQSKRDLGTKLRLFSAQQQDLEQLEITKWLERLLDYIHITTIKKIPKDVQQYVCYFRPKVLPSKKVLIERRMQRHQQSEQQASAHYTQFVAAKIDTAFVNMRSHTKQNSFRLFICEDSACNKDEIQIEFNSYGLSRKARLPKF